MKTNAGHFSCMIPGSSSSLQNDATNQLASRVNRANHFLFSALDVCQYERI